MASRRVLVLDVEPSHLLVLDAVGELQLEVIGSQHDLDAGSTADREALAGLHQLRFHREYTLPNPPNEDGCPRSTHIA